ncbi:hypothetical protein PENSPDRAFT_383937 [Peniophora sp. CONT]|nr:hypothetical protein PENSPDRAFT_383937 [Peniophora sp. CONT]
MKSLFRSHSRSHSNPSLETLLHDPTRPPLVINVSSEEDLRSDSAFEAAAENARNRVKRRDIRRMVEGAFVRRKVGSGSDRTVRAGEGGNGSGRGSRREEEQNPLRVERLRSRTSPRERPTDEKSEKERLRTARDKPLPTLPAPPAYEPERDRTLPWLERAQKHLSDPNAQKAARISDLFSEPDSATVVGEETDATVAHPDHHKWSSRAVRGGRDGQKSYGDEAVVAQTKAKHIEAWLEATASYGAMKGQHIHDHAGRIAAGRAPPMLKKDEQPRLYPAEIWMDAASSSGTSSSDYTESVDRVRIARSRTRRGRAIRRDPDRTPMPSRTTRHNIQGLPSPPPSSSSGPTTPIESPTQADSTVHSRDSYQSYTSERSDTLVVQLTELQRTVSEAHAHSDPIWVLKMYMAGLDRALKLGLPSREAQEQAMAAAAYEVGEACARALARLVD